MSAGASKESAGGGRAERLALLVVAAVGALVLLWRLDDRYLWQDEAACAVLAQRMWESGKPYSYDGTNLITMDVFAKDDADSIGERTGAPERAVEHFVEQGDFKADTTWIGQPWGQFVVAGASLELFGSSTLAARLPFALAGVATLVLLHRLLRRAGADRATAWLAVVLCLGSVYWFLHVRQCRYYGLSSLLLVTTVGAHLRWVARGGALRDGLLFAAVGWVYFHCDFGSFWPVLGVLFLDALRVRGRLGGWRALLVPFVVLGLAVLPFVFYYELVGRLKETGYTWNARFTMTLALVNRYQLPLVLLPLFGWVLARAGRGERGPSGRTGTGAWELSPRHAPGLCLAIVLGQLAWMPLVSPYWFYRYVVDATPLSSYVVAFALVGVGRALAGGRRQGLGLGLALGAIVFATPWASRLVEPLIPVPDKYRALLPPAGAALRHELAVWRAELAGGAPDPNGQVVELLSPRLAPGDEIFVNYEDIPLMFYLPGHPIRGGIPHFRIEDDGGSPPRFAVLRPSVTVTHWKAYERAFARHGWRELETAAPDITWGNNPDPLFHWTVQLEKARGRESLRVYSNVEGEGR